MQVCVNWTAFVLPHCFLKQGLSFILLYLTILSLFSIYGYQTNTNQIYFSAVHILNGTPQHAHSSLWLSSSCPAIFSIPRLC